MIILALDLSMSSTGYALWNSESKEPVKFGHTELGSVWTEGGDRPRLEGKVFANCHKMLTRICADARPDAMFIEEALDPRNLSGFTNLNSLRLLSGLNAHAKSFGVAMGVPIIREVHQSTWRKSWLGPLRRGIKRQDLKAMAVARAKLLGFKVRVHDEAEAIAILTYGCLKLKIQPPWLADIVFEPTAEELIA